MNKKIIATVLFSIISFSGNVVYAAENAVDTINTASDQQNKNEKLSDPDSTSTSVDNESNSKDKKFDISNIIDEVKNKDISSDDINNYTVDIKNKINESMVSYFNEIQSSMKILSDDNSVATDDIKKRVSSLNDKINDTIKSFNQGETDQKIKDQFQSISQEYIQIIKDYKVELEKRIKEKNDELEKINDVSKNQKK